MARLGGLERDVADALREAFEAINGLRFEHHAAQVQAGLPPDNLIDPEELAPIARAELREALHVVRRAQKRAGRRREFAARVCSSAGRHIHRSKVCARTPLATGPAGSSLIAHVWDCGSLHEVGHASGPARRASREHARAALGPRAGQRGRRVLPRPGAARLVQGVAALAVADARLGGADRRARRTSSASVAAARARDARRVRRRGARPRTPQAWLLEHHPELTLMSAGRSIEIYKEAALPTRFRRALRARARSPAATRSVTPGWRPRAGSRPQHSHPFSTGLDLCLVHNGSLSNHNRLRRTLQREGMVVPDRERQRGRGRLPDVAAARGRDAWSRRSRAAWRISTASTRSPSGPPTGSRCCATRSRASRP